MDPLITAHHPNASSVAGFSSSSKVCNASTSYAHYDVFINHRGPDVKNTFARTLYLSLKSRGLQVFLDKEELRVGRKVSTDIEAAIRVASVHIAIFSPNYARSNWCLDELVLMVNSKGMILPVFYNVKPSDIRWTGKDKDGEYAKALRNHEEQQRYDPQTIQNWRKALSHCADIYGLELEACNRDEEELLDKVLQNVQKNVPKLPLNVATYPTGLVEKMEEFERTVLSVQQEERMEALIVGIVGIGGIGKTTLAKEYFDSKRSDYNGSSFLFDARENARRMSLHHLQSKLIKDLKDVDTEIKRSEEGVGILKSNLSSCHALIVLDDIDHIDQLDAILPIRHVLHRKSLILVTSRDKHVLISARILESSIYQLRGLSRPQSRELFSLHAFFQPHPLPGFEDLVDRFLMICHDLPLSLKVLGALVCGHDKAYWEEQLTGIHKALPSEIEESLRISYDSLNHEEQQIFLDIACFSIGEKRGKWIRIWGGSGWRGLVGLRNLENKCLVEVDKENKIRMHDHLRDMGRKIADSSLLMPRRLWQPINNLHDLHDMLDQSSPGSASCYNCLLFLKHKQVITEVRGFRMASESTQRNTGEEGWNRRSRHEVLGMTKLQLLEAEGKSLENILTCVRSPKLIWLRWSWCPCSSLPSWIAMNNLRVLEVQGTKLERLWLCESQAPLQLRELNIDAPLLEFPKSLGQLKHLEKLVLRIPLPKRLPEEFGVSEEFFDLCSLKFLSLNLYGSLKMLPNSVGNLINLEHLDLCGSASLNMIPDTLGNLTNLQHLDLSWCQSLITLPDSLGNLKNLHHLYLSECKNLNMLPDSLGNLENLHHLDLSKCKSLNMLPVSLGNLRSLRHMNLSSCKSLIVLPDSIGRLINLSFLDLSRCKSLAILPNSIGNLTNIQKFDFTCCQSLEMLPKSMGNLRNLHEIVLSSCKRLEMLPESLGNLTKLQHLPLQNCENLKILPNSLGNLTNLHHIDLTGCQSLKILPDSFQNLVQLKHLHFWGCCNLTISSETIANITTLECLNLENCLQLELLPPQVGHQPSLERLNLLDTNMKEFVSDVECLGNLQVLSLGSPLLQVLPPTLGYLVSLKELCFHRCHKLQCLPDSVGLLTQLTELNISDCGIRYLPHAVMKMNNLKILRVHGCPLRELPFRGQRAFSELDSSINKGMFHLQELWLSVTEISEISFAEGVCPNLQHLKIVCCNDLVEIGALPITLISLKFEFCYALRKIGGLHGLAELKKLVISNCNLEEDELPGIQTLISSGLELSSIPLDTSQEERDSALARALMVLDDAYISYVLSKPFCQ